MLSGIKNAVKQRNELSESINILRPDAIGDIIDTFIIESDVDEILNEQNKLEDDKFGIMLNESEDDNDEDDNDSEEYKVDLNLDDDDEEDEDEEDDDLSINMDIEEDEDEVSNSPGSNISDNLEEDITIDTDLAADVDEMSDSDLLDITINLGTNTMVDVRPREPGNINDATTDEEMDIPQNSLIIDESALFGTDSFTKSSLFKPSRLFKDSDKTNSESDDVLNEGFFNISSPIESGELNFVIEALTIDDSEEDEPDKDSDDDTDGKTVRELVKDKIKDFDDDEDKDPDDEDKDSDDIEEMPEDLSDDMPTDDMDDNSEIDGEEINDILDDALSSIVDVKNKLRSMIN